MTVEAVKDRLLTFFEEALAELPAKERAQVIEAMRPSKPDFASDEQEGAR